MARTGPKGRADVKKARVRLVSATPAHRPGGAGGETSKTTFWNRTVPRPRDAFGLALGALRRRLRSGVDAPGATLPINLIAAELRLSSTPVREALSRLAGEDLVEKRGPAYTRPRLDGPALAELYHLRLLYLGAALAPDAERRAKHREWPTRAPFRFAADLAEPDRDPAMVVEALFLELVLGADDLILAQAYQRSAERLAPFQPIEAQLFTDVSAEALGLVAAFETGEGAALRGAVRSHHRRRIGAAHAIARLAGGGKYRPDIV